MVRTRTSLLAKIAGLGLLLGQATFLTGCSESLAGMKDYLPLIQGAASLFAATQDYDANDPDSSLTAASQDFAGGVYSTGSALEKTRLKNQADAEKFKKEGPGIIEGQKEEQAETGAQLEGAKTRKEELEAQRKTVEGQTMEPEAKEKALADLDRQIDQVDDDIETLQGRYDDLAKSITENEERLAGIDEELDSYKTYADRRAEREAADKKREEDRLESYVRTPEGEKGASTADTTGEANVYGR